VAAGSGVPSSRTAHPELDIARAAGPPASGGRGGGDIADRFAAAVSRQQHGDLQEAERLYRLILRKAPDHVAALYHLGLICANRGRLEEGARLIRHALRRNPAWAEAHNDLGAVLKRLGRLEDAAASFSAALVHDPASAKAHYNLGAALQALGRLEPALGHFRQALAADPTLVVAHGDLGVALADLGRLDEALPHYEQALALDPDNLKARINLGKILQAHGRPEDALACFEAVLSRERDSAEPIPADVRARVAMLLMQLGRLEPACAAFRLALASTPDFAELHCNLGATLLKLHRPDEAIGCLERAIALKPGMTEAHYNLGNALQLLGRYERAAACHRAALALRPHYVNAHNNLGGALAALGRHDDALACYRAALAIAPNSTETQHNIGTALAALGREDDALAWYDKVLAIEPSNAAVLANVGNALKALGRFDEARAVLERAIALDPLVPRFYRSLAECGPVHADNRLRSALEALTRDIAALPPPERIHLHFALAKVYDDAAEPGPAFEQLCAGNALKRRSITYDEAATLAGIEQLRAVFTPALLLDHAGVGEPDATPVFIVGMPRSGTTLVEQILASHRLVFGAGELECFPQAVAALTKREQAVGRFPELLGSLGADGWRALGKDYLRATRPLAPAAARITDKLPLNVIHVGLIHLALPNARVVHVRRDPLDTCLSCFSLEFAGNQPFVYDLGELGRYYRAYDALMAHWRALLPDGVMLELHYEELVADFERQARRLVAHCGLAWDDSCLAFHEATRPVRTASLVQVRQPLYRTAVGRAQRYRHLLGPLIDALAGPGAAAAGPAATLGPHLADTDADRSAGGSRQ
jgi:tetratricopeptide (TPR) repeat protein